MSVGAFTDSEYASLVELAAQRFSFVPFTQYDQNEPAALWRHDVDLSVHRAAALARIEHRLNVRATYFVHIHSNFYNPFEADVSRLLREIVEMQHLLGLHFDPAYYSGKADLEVRLEREKRVLEELFDVEVEAFSIHNPTETEWDESRTVVASMINASSAEIASRYTYCSDSNGLWRYRSLVDVLQLASETHIQVLTHPEWWVPEQLPPRARVTRCIEGRASRQHEWYDQLLADAGRPNVRRLEGES